VAWALASPNIDERQVLTAVLDEDPHLITGRPGLLIIGDKGYISAALDRCWLNAGSGYYDPRTATDDPDPANTCSNRSGS
jgi:hypothetical protein